MSSESMPRKCWRFTPPSRWASSATSPTADAVGRLPGGRPFPFHEEDQRMADGDLVSMADVKAYLGGDLQSNDDAVLARLISAASAFFVTACARPILQRTYSELYD